MRTFSFLLLLFCALPLTAQGVVVTITRAGIGATPDGACRSDVAAADCRAFDGNQNLTVAPGAEVGLFLEWRNDGSADIREVRATDQMGNIILPTLVRTLFPGETDFENIFFPAPAIPGSYTILLTLTATDFNDREDTDQFRYFLTVDQSLPVALTDFRAAPTDKGQVDLTWRTLQETNHDSFEVERSADGRTFHQVGAAAGAGESFTEQAYHFRDETPLAGRNFYRLRQVDLDGSSRYSYVVAATPVATFRVYPNPTREGLSLAGFAGGWVAVFDGLGRRLLVRQLAAGSPLSVSELAPGRYLLKTASGQQWWVKQ